MIDKKEEIEDNQKYSEDNVIQSLKPTFRKRAKFLLEEISLSDPSKLTIDEFGKIVVFRRVLDSDLCSILSDLFYKNSKKSNQEDLKSFILALQNLGLSRFIPKSKFVKNDSESKIVSPFNTDKWYFIGQ